MLWCYVLAALRFLACRIIQRVLDLRILSQFNFQLHIHSNSNSLSVFLLVMLFACLHSLLSYTVVLFGRTPLVSHAWTLIYSGNFRGRKNCYSGQNQPRLNFLMSLRVSHSCGIFFFYFGYEDLVIFFFSFVLCMKLLCSNFSWDYDWSMCFCWINIEV